MLSPVSTRLDSRSKTFHTAFSPGWFPYRTAAFR
jgi:hypothetical protein